MNAPHPDAFHAYLAASEQRSPLFVRGDAAEVLPNLANESVDFCMTSPPYWGLREYGAGGIGQEATVQEYIAKLVSVFGAVKRVLKPTGSFWLNMGDTYQHKSLYGVPWRLAIALVDSQGWVLRNGIVWHKVKGGLDQSSDKLRNVHEYVFHFVKQPKGYFYDADAVKSDPRKSKVVGGAVVSATGVSGVRYHRQIELSTSLSDAEKTRAQEGLDQILDQVRGGELSDSRMIIRGQQRTTHSDASGVSGRAKELAQKGFYFLKYDPKGTKPSDVWEMIPEYTRLRGLHYAPSPESLCLIPLLATCPEDGIVLDPFCGTGTTNAAAFKLGRKSIGIDLCQDYLDYAKRRVFTLFIQNAPFVG